MLLLAIEFFSLSCDCDAVISVQYDGGWGGQGACYFWHVQGIAIHRTG